jgi:periplasmic protein TonB
MAGMNTLWRFVALSLATHALALLFLYPLRSAIAPHTEVIPVSVLPNLEKEKAEPAPSRVPRMPPTRASKAPSIIAKKDSPLTAPKSSPSRDKTARNENVRPEPNPEPAPAAPQPRTEIPEQSAIAERPLPTLKELLPSATWSSSSARASAPISLNTKDPVYVTYFNKIKQLIESQWEYPELALRYGLQGRLSLEFMIGSNGELEQLRLIRSSGSQVLDEEALRAIKASAPYPPIPPWIKPNPLLISATMEYHDNRLDYRFAR